MEVTTPGKLDPEASALDPQSKRAGDIAHHSPFAAHPAGFWGQAPPLGALPPQYLPPGLQIWQQQAATGSGEAPAPVKGPQNIRLDTKGSDEQRSEATHSGSGSPGRPAPQPLPESPAAQAQRPVAATGFVRVQPSGGAAAAATAAARAAQTGTELWHPKPRPASAADLQALAMGIGSLAPADAQALGSLNSADAETVGDEREGKRLRRKQSNRESARRSRLRKQAESETLSGRVESLIAENHELREVNRHLQSRLDALLGAPQQAPAPPEPEQGMQEAAATLQSVAASRPERWRQMAVAGS